MAIPLVLAAEEVRWSHILQRLEARVVMEEAVHWQPLSGPPSATPALPAPSPQQPSYAAGGRAALAPAVRLLHA